MEKEVDDGRDRRLVVRYAEINPYTLPIWSMTPPLLDDFVLSIDVISQSCKEWSHYYKVCPRCLRLIHKWLCPLESWSQLDGLAVGHKLVVVEFTDWGNVF